MPPLLGLLLVSVRCTSSTTLESGPPSGHLSANKAMRVSAKHQKIWAYQALEALSGCAADLHSRPSSLGLVVLPLCHSSTSINKHAQTLQLHWNLVYPETAGRRV